MAATDRQPRSDLIQELLDEPHEFDFFQAVRLIELFLMGERQHPTPSPIGGDSGPHKEPIRFRAMPSLSFPPGQIASVRSRTQRKSEAADNETNGRNSVNESTSADRIPVDMMVSFMGLTGPNGVLPQHYTSLVIERSHQSIKDDTLREFFDLFNHRAISFFYRAWEKYRFQFRYERNLFASEYEDDLFTRCLFSLVGLEIPGLRHQFSFDDQALIFYGGLTAQRCRNAIGLEQILKSYFDVPTEVIQFVGQWLDLPTELQTSLPSAAHPLGQNLKLGESAVIGSRAWDVQSRFRVRIGPLSSEKFEQLLPGETLDSIAEMIRFYVGPEKDFDIQLVLRRQDVSALKLSKDGSPQPLLGWNTWLSPTS
ncbi:MAG: type VI secretion system baseplate subunit TssG, partial [Fuerstiella sp.]